ncbi:MAG: Ig-like domain-containing protein [Bermanella sp.]
MLSATPLWQILKLSIGSAMPARQLNKSIILIYMIFTLSACDFNDEPTNSGEVINLDSTPPVLTQIPFDDVFTESGVSFSDNEWTTDNTPTIILVSNEIGTATFDGSCRIPATIKFVTDKNSITFPELADGLYADCTISLKDASGNASDILTLAPFTIDTLAPILASSLALPIKEGGTSTVAIVFEDALSAESQTTYTTVSLPEFGTLMISGANVQLGDTFTQNQLTNGVLLYKHNNGEESVDIFTFTVEDFLRNVTKTATYTINISNVNDAPVARPDDSYTTEETAIVDFDVLSNDSDEEADELTITTATVDSTRGEVNIANDKKTLTFTPKTGQLGEIVVNYTITDRVHPADDANFVTSTWTITVSDNYPPEVVITFPPTKNSLTNRKNITIRGIASDLSEIVALRINGINASSTDNFANWYATIPLNSGSNRIELESSDSTGNINLATPETTINRNLLFKRPIDVVLDHENNRALLIDNELDALAAVDLNTGIATILSDSSTGTGPDLEFPDSIVHDIDKNRVLITDRNLKALLAVDLSSGNRTVLSNENTGDGLNFNWPQSVALNTLTNRGLIIDSNLDALIEVNLSNGDRIVISDNNGVGNGLEFGTPIKAVFDAINNRVLILDVGWGVLLGVDLETGDRTVLSGIPLAAPFPLTGAGPGFTNPKSLTLDVANNRVLVINATNYTPDLLMAVDLVTGDRTVISESDLNSETNFGWPVGITLDAKNDRALVVDSFRDTLISVNLSTGNRATVLAGGIGDGLAFDQLGSIAFDAVNSRVLANDNGRFAISSIDLFTGNRSVISSGHVEEESVSTRGEGAKFKTLRTVTMDVDNNRALLINSNEDTTNSMVMAVDLVSGDRTVISDTSSVGSTINSIASFYPKKLALDLVNNRIVAASESGVLFLVDLTTGDRTVLSDEGAAVNLNFSDISSIAIDTMNNRAFITIYEQKLLFEIDLITGVAAIVSASDAGTGPELKGPVSVAWDLANSRVIVMSETLFDGSNVDGLFVVDISSGDRTVVSAAGKGIGPNFCSPREVVLDVDNDLVFVSDRCLSALFAVDLSSGDRVIISR